MIDSEEFFEEIKEPFGEWTEKDAKELEALLSRFVFKKAVQAINYLLSKKTEQLLGLRILSRTEDAETFLRVQGEVKGHLDFIQNLLELTTIQEDETAIEQEEEKE